MKLKYFVFLLTSIILFNWSCNDSIVDIEETTATPIHSKIDTINIDEDIIEINEESTDTIIQPKRKCIYLTIDDGPLYGGKYIDSIATAKQVKTNLFVVGASVKGSGTFKKYYDMFVENAYIEIYNHSYSHANHRYSNYYKSPELVLEDFEKNQDLLSISHKIARLPGRNLWIVGEKTKNTKQSGNTSAQLLADEGYDVYGWDVEWEYDSKDYVPKQTIEELVEEINKAYKSNKTFVPEHVVLLMHDQMFSKSNSKNDLAELIDKLQSEGYTFEYMTSYPKP